MSPSNPANRDFWWTDDHSENFWIEQLKTEGDGDRLWAPDTSTYRAVHGVEVGEIILHWHSERRPDIKPGLSGIYAVSRVIGRTHAAADRWEGQLSIEAPLTRKVPLNRPILLRDLKLRQDEFKQNLDELKRTVGRKSHFSPWQFPGTGLKPVTRYLTKLTSQDLEVIVADHPHLATAIARA